MNAMDNLDAVAVSDGSEYHAERVLMARRLTAWARAEYGLGEDMELVWAEVPRAPRQVGVPGVATGQCPVDGTGVGAIHSAPVDSADLPEFRPAHAGGSA